MKAMAKTCDKCGSSFLIVVADGRASRTTNDGILRMEVIWRCPVCSHDNSEVGIFSYEPIKIADGLSIPLRTHLVLTEPNAAVQGARRKD